MMRFKIEKGEGFERALEGYLPNVREKIEKEFIGRIFSSWEEIINNLPPGWYIPKKGYIEIDKLPYTIEEWPIYLGTRPLECWDAAKIKVIKE